MTSFGGVKEFKEAFAKAAVAQFGSGWAWLVKGKGDKLEIATTSNRVSTVVPTLIMWSTGFAREVRLLQRRVLKRFDNTARSLYAVAA